MYVYVHMHMYMRMHARTCTHRDGHVDGLLSLM